jgi:hypothetical protein
VGDIWYLMKCGETYIFSNYNNKQDQATLQIFKKDLKYKFLIDKYCKTDGCIEIVVSNDKIYLTNIFKKEKIVD